MSKLIKLFKHRLIYLVVKIIKYAKFVRIYILYYEVLRTFYINLILNKVVTLFLFLSAFVLKANFFFYYV